MEKREHSGFWEFIKKHSKRYFIDALGAMALGLFSSLIIGLIMTQIINLIWPEIAAAVTLERFGECVKLLTAGQARGLEFIEVFKYLIGSSSPVVGAAIGVAVAWGLKGKPLTMFSSAVTGAYGYMLGGPVGCYIAALVGAEFGRMVAGCTKIDIILTPIVTILTGCIAGWLVGPAVSALMTSLGQLIMRATELQPFFMGIAVAVIMGMILTAPISSAALCIMLGLSGLAAGAATVGCCAQMVGFAVASFRENRWGGLIAQGLGTSMLQVPNIVRHPQIWIPPTLASAILGPVSTLVFGMTNIPLGAGMGTSGLVGQVGTFTTMTGIYGFWPLFIIVAGLHFIAPAVLTLLFSELMRRKGWIKPGDMLLPS
jgi:uncharacterized membrane protein